MQFISRTIKKYSKYRWQVIAALGALTVAGVCAIQVVMSHHSNSNTAKTVETSAAEQPKIAQHTPKTNSQQSKSKNDDNHPSQATPTSPSSGTQENSNSNTADLPSVSIVDDKGPQPTPDPKPNFRLELLQPPSNNSFGFILKSTELISPSEITQYSEPQVLFSSAGAPDCANTIYYINSNDSWGFSCTMYSGAVHGQWPITFKVTAKNIYNQSATKTVTGVVVYKENQTGYENILNY